MIQHPTNHSKIVFADGKLFTKTSSSMFDGLLVFADGFTGLHALAWDAVNSGQIHCPYRIHGLEHSDGVRPGQVGSTIIRDLDFLSGQGCRRIGIHAPNDICGAKTALRAAVDWLRMNPEAVDTLTFVDAGDDYYNVFGFESFREDRMMRNVSPTDFESYYENEFQDHLQDVFGAGADVDEIMMVNVERIESPEDKLPLFTEVDFSVALFFTALVPQVIAKVSGQLQDMYDFLKLSHIPMLTRGLGGTMAPYTFLEYGNLLPKDSEWFFLARQEVGYFYRVITHYLIGGIQKAMSVPAKNLSRLSGQQIKAMRQEMKRYIDSLESCMKEGKEMPNYYLPEEILQQQV